MKPQYQTRYELLHESYQKWLTGFTRHAVSWGVCHPNIYYFHNLTPGWVSFNGEKPEIAIVPGFAPIFPDICYHLTHYKPAA
ncbi:hypothetical protein, partial [Escherichia coli]|uniref:hypothetical protein n=1 Tax=Escherichia coli TaxID=562 RepID=UPI002021E962